MEKLSESLPDVEAFEKKLNDVLESNLSDFVSNTHDRRKMVKHSLLFMLLALSFLIAASVFLFNIQTVYSPTVFKVVLALSLAWTTVLMVAGAAWTINIKILAREMNMALAPIFSTIFDRTFLYTNNEQNKVKLLELLKDSELMTLKDFEINADDSYMVFCKTDIEFHEITIESNIPGKDKGNKNAIELFRGLLMVANLSIAHNAETYISTEGDKVGFAHRTFWSSLLGHEKVKETELEWNDFEKELHVATSDPVAARELLTPDFMNDLHDWWTEHKLNIRISFKGDKMYLLLPEATIHIASSTTSSKLSIIKRYATTLARPMWRGLRLVEDVCAR